MKKIYFAAETNATEVEDYSIDWSKQTAFNFWAPDDVKPHLSVTADGLQAENTKAMDNYLFQYQGASNLGLTKGKDYTLKIVMKGSAEGKMHLAIGEWGNRMKKALSTAICTLSIQGKVARTHGISRLSMICLPLWRRMLLIPCR